MDKELRERFWNYFDIRREQLWQAIIASNESLTKEGDRLIQLADKNPSSEWRRGFMHHLWIENALKYGHLVAVCSLLESAVKILCKHLDHGYVEQKVDKKYRSQGNWLKKHLLYLTDNNLISNAEGIRGYEAELSHAITLRNCIGHAYGNISEYRHPEQVRASIKHVAQNHSNCDFACESEDGHLVIGDDLIPHVFNHCEELIRLLLDI